MSGASLDAAARLRVSPLDAPGLEPAWVRLRDRAGHAHPFSWPGWYRALADCSAEEPAYRVAELWRGDQLTGLAYFSERPERDAIALAGRRDLLDYFTPLRADGAGSELATALVEHVLARGARRFEAPHLPACCTFAAELVDAALAADLAVDATLGEPTVVLTLPSSWEEYLALLSSRDRHELRRKRRRLEAAHPGARVRCSTAATLAEDVECFIDLHTRQPGEKGRFLRGWRATFFRRLAHDLLAQGQLRLAFLEDGGDPLAATFGFSDGATYSLYNSAFDAAHAYISPGLYLVSELIRESIEDGHGTFDFLRGTERYKERLGGRRIPIVDLVLDLPSAPKGRR